MVYPQFFALSKKYHDIPTKFLVLGSLLIATQYSCKILHNKSKFTAVRDILKLSESYQPEYIRQK